MGMGKVWILFLKMDMGDGTTKPAPYSPHCHP